MTFLEIILTILISYSLGALPIAYIIARIKGVNIFEKGSGNMGATNVARSVGYKWALLAAALDILKGVVAIIIVRAIVAEDQHAAATILAAICAVFGHMYTILTLPITGRIQGGKGVATAFGTWFVFIDPLIIATIIVFLVFVVWATRYVSLGSVSIQFIMTAVITLLVAGGNLDSAYLAYVVICALIVFRHRDNIRALIAGRERKWGQKA
jgi:acyl phosphate:glycerol-3-phosphate acyltransferase